MEKILFILPRVLGREEKILQLGGGEVGAGERVERVAALLPLTVKRERAGAHQQHLVDS